MVVAKGRIIIDQREEIDIVYDQSGPEITKDEVEYTIKEIKEKYLNYQGSQHTHYNRSL